MTFSSEQIAALSAPLSSSHVKTRTQSGRTLSYVEGWHAIAEANRIFGFGAWTRETMDIRCVAERERKIGRAPNERSGWGVSYIAKVRVTVDGVVREGVGSGHGIDVDLGLAHESAIKEAETDAMKRALMTFGNPFGLALYDKEQANVCDERHAPAPVVTSGAPKANDDRECDALIESMSRCRSEADLNEWQKLNAPTLDGMSEPSKARLRRCFGERRAALRIPGIERAA